MCWSLINFTVRRLWTGTLSTVPLIYANLDTTSFIVRGCSTGGLEGLDSLPRSKIYHNTCDATQID